MSNIERFENLKQIVRLVQPQFDELAVIHNAVNYKKEASFALQILSSNDYIASIAMADQDSLKRAIVNVAAIGLSLNPILKLSYLIPRKKKICLDISYLGYIELAISVGAIKWAAAEVVRANDTYLYKGMGQMPVHEFDPFGDRGEIKGAYCVAKTHDGEYILTQMSNEQILSVRDRSESYLAWVNDNSKSTPWKTDTDEMIKKTVIRRAYKAWPKSSTKDDRFEKAIDVTNDIILTDAIQPVAISPEAIERDEKFAKIREALAELGRTEAKFIEHLTRVNRREIKTLSDLTDIEISQAIVMLNQFVDQKIAKEQKNEVPNSDSKKS